MKYILTAVNKKTGRTIKIGKPDTLKRIQKFKESHNGCIGKHYNDYDYEIAEHVQHFTTAKKEDYALVVSGYIHVNKDGMRVSPVFGDALTAIDFLDDSQHSIVEVI